MSVEFFEVVRVSSGAVMLRPAGDKTATLFEPPQDLIQSGIDLADPTVTLVQREPNDVGPGFTWTARRGAQNSFHAVHTR